MDLGIIWIITKILISWFNLNVQKDIKYCFALLILIFLFKFYKNLTVIENYKKNIPISIKVFLCCRGKGQQIKSHNLLQDDIR